MDEARQRREAPLKFNTRNFGAHELARLTTSGGTPSKLC